MRSVYGVLTAFVVSGYLVSASQAEARVSLTDYCQELQLLQEVTKPGLTVESQAAILARAMQFPKFRELVKAHAERNFSVAEIDAAMRACRENRRLPPRDTLDHRPPDRPDSHRAVLWIGLALGVTVVAIILLVGALRERPEKLVPPKPPPEDDLDWEQEEEALRAELDELRKDIEDRSK